MWLCMSHLMLSFYSQVMYSDSFLACSTSGQSLFLVSFISCVRSSSMKISLSLSQVDVLASLQTLSLQDLDRNCTMTRQLGWALPEGGPSLCTTSTEKVSWSAMSRDTWLNSSMIVLLMFSPGRSGNAKIPPSFVGVQTVTLSHGAQCFLSPEW